MIKKHPSSFPAKRERHLALGKKLATLACCLLAIIPFETAPALAGTALPTGGQFIAGTGNISSGTPSLTVNQSSTRGIIDWQSFSIGAGNKVQFNNGGGATLNRVVGNNFSQILGSLSATGSVYLINPQGIVVGREGNIVTNGTFVASTRDIDNGSFMAGDAPHFTGTSNGNVDNQGEITSATGDIVLIGSSVRNDGTINAPQGAARLAAGDDVLLQPADATNSGVYVSAGNGNVTNEGTITAAQAALAAANGNVYALAGNNGGIIRATGTSVRKGHVWLTADGDVTVKSDVMARNADGSGGAIDVSAGPSSGKIKTSGTLDASASNSTTSGGQIVLSAADINVGASAKINADGGTQGGTILIGGDRHGGSDPSLDLISQAIPDAITTSVAAGAVITADATNDGDGGDIVLWSNKQTKDGAFLSAMGGSQGGNGGFIEVSSAELLDYIGQSMLLAPKGNSGMLLLDPENVTIQTNSGTPADTCASGVCTPPGDTSILTVAALQSALAGGNVTVNTGSTGSQTGNITVANNITWSNGDLLLLSAAGGITISSGVTISNTYTGSTFGAGSIPVVLALRADSAGTVNGSNVSSNSYGVTNNGTINMAGSTGAVSIFNDSGFTAVNGTQTANSSWTAPANSSIAAQFTTYKLINGIGDLAGITLSNIYALGKNITGGGSTTFNSNTPLGTFTGTLDGQYCALAGASACGVSGYALTSNSANGVGLFATNNGTIRNLSLGFTLSDTYDGLSTQNEGMLAGTNGGTIANVSATSSGSVAYTDTNILVATNTANVGGLVGLNTGTIKNATAADGLTYTYQGASTLGSTVNAGGLVGLNTSTATTSISGSSASGTVAAAFSTNGCSGSACSGAVTGDLGGLIGQNGNLTATAISGSSASGNVSSNLNGGNEYIGGLVGYNDSTSTSSILSSSTATGTPSYTGTSSFYLGGFAGYNGAGTIGSSSSSEAVSYSGGTAAFVGGFAGYNGGTLSSDTATGNVGLTTGGTVTSYAGGLVAFNAGTITGSATNTGIVTVTNTVSGSAANTLYAGGLVGANTDPGGITSSTSSEAVNYIYQGTSNSTSTAYAGGLLGSDASLLSVSVSGSSATGNVTAQYSQTGCSGGPCTGNVTGSLGGLIGISGLSIAVVTAQNFAGGNVTSSLSGGSEYLGGLVGLNSSVLLVGISNSYAMGDVTYTGTSTGALIGGLIGDNVLGTIANSYAAGSITGGAGTAGGLIGANLGIISNDYWDINTTGQSLSSGGTGLLTAQLQAGLPTGFSSSVWGIVAGASYPYLQSQFSGTPQVVAGIAYSDHGSTILAGANVNALLNGQPLVSALTNAVISDKNGYYYYLLAPGTISASGSGILTYLTGTTKGVQFTDGATGSITGANIYGNYLTLSSSGSTVSGLVNDLSTAIGSNTGSNLPFTIGSGTLTMNSGVNLQANLSGASAVIDDALNLSGGALLNLNTTGSVTESAAITAPNLLLQGSGATYDLTGATNAVGTLAASIGSGTASLANGATNLAIGSVGGVSGVAAGTLNLTGTGTVTESQGIAAANLSLQGAGTFTLTGATNAIGTLAASVGSGIVSLANGATNLVLGTVNSINGVTAATLNLTDTGSVTQSKAIVATNVSLQGSGGAYTLTNASNSIGTIAANTGSLNLTDGASVSVGTVNSIAGITTTGSTTIADSGTLTLANVISAGGGGTSIQLSDQVFVNNAGSSALAAGSGGRFLVWSGNPANDTRGGLAYAFKQYNATLGVTTVAQSTGNGFLYTLAPVFTVGLTGSISKTYNDTTAAALVSGNYSTSNSAVDGDTVTFTTPTSGTYSTANAGTGLTVSVSGIAINSATNGSATVYGYQVNSAANAAIAVITPATITATIVANNKVYNGTTAATISSIGFTGTAYGSDASNLTVTDTGAAFNTKDVLTANLVTATGLALSGAAASDYQLSATTATAAASITPATLTGTITANNKVYNGTTAATLSSIGFTGTTYGSDATNLTVTDTSANFNTKDVATANLVTAAGLSLSGLASGNYQLSATTATAAASITPATITGIIVANNKVYNGTTTATLASISASGVISADIGNVSISDTGATFNTKDVATANTVTAVGLSLSGSAASDYQLSANTAQASASITPATLSATIAANNKVYDGTTTATLSSTGFTGTTYGSDSSNLTVTDTAANFNTKDVLTANLVTATGLALTGTAAGDYQLSATSATTAAAITAAPITASIVANNKVYDGTTTATLASITPNGVIAADAANLSVSDTGATFNTKDVLTANTVTAAGLSLSGSAAGDYHLTATTAQAAASISPAPVTGVIVANNKVYNGTTTATLSSESVSGVIAGDAASVALNVTAANFNTKDVPTADLVTATGLSLAGAAAGDYALISTSATAAADITPATLTGTIAANNKVYNGTTAATLSSIGFTGTTYGSDATNLTVTDTGATFNTKDVLTANTVTATGLALTGTAAVDYQLSANTAQTSASITPATLTGTIVANNKVYDGTTTATLASTGFTGTTYNSDSSHLTVTFSSAAFNSKDVLTANTVTASGLALSGSAASDYQLSATTATASASITPATLTGTITANNKVYNGTTAATLSSIGFNGTTYGSDASNLGITDTGATFNTKDVLTANTVTATGLSLTGSVAADYQLSATTAQAPASITPAPLTGTITANNKVYNGTTAATLSSIGFTGTTYGSDAGNLTITDAGATFNTKDVLTANTVTATSLSLSGSASADYQLSVTTAQAPASITPATLTGVITASNKVYDTTTTATLSSVGYIGTTYGNDASNLTISATAANFNAKDVLIANTVTATGLALGGSAASDYQLSSTTAQALAGITPAPVTPVIIANNKVYDGTTTATLASVTSSGVYSSDAANVSLNYAAANFNSPNVGTATTVTATGFSLAGSAASDYALTTTTAQASASITPAPLSGLLVPGIVANNKVYDGTTTATIASTSLTGVLAGDTGDVTLTYTAANFNSPNVATATTVTATGLGLAGSAASNYGLSVSSVSAPASITPAPLTATIAANNKVYDGTTAATLASTGFTGTIFGSDSSNLSVTATAANFNTKDVATANLVTATGLALGGTAATNYALTSTTATAAADITPAPITGVIAANNKVYNGTTTATLSGESVSGVIAADVANVSLNVTAANFNTKDVPTANTVTATGLSLTGSAAGDYALVSTSATASADITPATLTPAIVANTKTYNGTTAATLSSIGFTGTTYGSDASNLTITDTGAVFNTKDVLTANLVTATGLSLTGSAAGDYQLSATTASAPSGITPATLTGTIVADNKVYDGTTAAMLESVSYTGTTYSSDASNLSISAASAAFNSKDVLTADTVTAAGLSLGGAAAGNYQLASTTAQASASITPATLTATIVANNKTYNGTTTATLASTNLNGLIAADSSNVSLTVGAASFNTKDVATADLVTASGLSLSGTAASDYALSSTSATAAASITPATLTATIVANNKTYNGTTTATLASTGFLGTAYGSDANNLSVTVTAANFNTKDVSTANTVTATGLSLTGSAADDYQLSSTSATASANITPATITGTIVANNKTYDGTTAATLAGTGFTGAIFGGDAAHLTLSDAAATFNSKDVLTANTVTATGLTLGGTAASDYQLSSTSASASASITPAPVTGAIVANNKTYDGTTTATLSAITPSGVLAADLANVTLTNTAANFNSKDVLTAASVTATGLALTGSAASDYSLTSASASVAASITPASVTGAIVANNKTYDGTTTATLASTSVNGIVAGDAGDVSLNVAAASFNTKDVATANTVTATGLSLSGSAAGDYQLTSTTATSSGHIMPATLTPTIVANTKTYDGTTAATLASTGFSGTVFGNDLANLTLTPSSVSFNSPDVALATTVTASGLTLGGAAAGDYQLSTTSASVAASITPATITVGSFTVANKSFNGSTQATITNDSLNGVLVGDKSNVALNTSQDATFSSANPGNNLLVSITGTQLTGSAASNYQLSLAGAPTVVANIVPVNGLPNNLTQFNQQVSSEREGTVIIGQSLLTNNTNVNWVPTIMGNSFTSAAVNIVAYDDGNGEFTYVVQVKDLWNDSPWSCTIVPNCSHLLRHDSPANHRLRYLEG